MTRRWGQQRGSELEEEQLNHGAKEHLYKIWLLEAPVTDLTAISHTQSNWNQVQLRGWTPVFIHRKCLKYGVWLLQSAGGSRGCRRNKRLVPRRVQVCFQRTFQPCFVSEDLTGPPLRTHSPP